jgi:hypothetical protein
MAMAGKPGEQLLLLSARSGRLSVIEASTKSLSAASRGWPKWPWLESLVSSCCC